MNMKKVNKLYPNLNYSCSLYIYIIENTLRELIIEELSKIDGSKWYNQSLPGVEIINKYLDAKQYQIKKHVGCNVFPFIQYIILIFLI